MGDQIHLKGMLVNYTDPASWKGFWRRSSLSRTDGGNKACEVVFVESFEIMKRGTPGWYLARTAGFWGLLLVLVAKAGLFIAATLARRR